MLRISKNTKIFLIIFSSLLFITTIGAIYYKNKNKDSEESHIIIESAEKIPQISSEEIKEQNFSSATGVSLDDVYSNNGLEYELVDDTTKNVKVTYIQVSGLKNEEVQESINTQIKERINKIVDSNNFKNNSDNSAYITCSVQSNFSDVLSIKVFARFKEGFNKSYGLNFRLDNGEKIKLNDLFVYNAPKKNIITKSAYRSFALEYYTNEGIMNDFYYNIEDDIISFLEEYNNGKIAEFSFTPFGIELYKDGRVVSINMLEYYKYYAIYSKYVSSNNLYMDNENVAKKIPVFVKRPESVVDLYEKINDTCILDVIIYCDEKLSSKEMVAVKNYKKYLVEELDKLKREQGLYYSNYIKVTKGNEDSEEILIFDEDECYVQMNGNDFVKEVYEKVISEERDINNTDLKTSKVRLLDDDLLKVGQGQKKYSVKTGKEFVKEKHARKKSEENEEATEQNETQDDETQRNIENAIEESQNNDNTNESVEVTDVIVQQTPQPSQSNTPESTSNTSVTSEPTPESRVLN